LTDAKFNFRLAGMDIKGQFANTRQKAMRHRRAAVAENSPGLAARAGQITKKG
jgi:hypothetical protein